MTVDNKVFFADIGERNFELDVYNYIIGPTPAYCIRICAGDAANNAQQALDVTNKLRQAEIPAILRSFGGVDVRVYGFLEGPEQHQLVVSAGRSLGAISSVGIPESFNPEHYSQIAGAKELGHGGIDIACSAVFASARSVANGHNGMFRLAPISRDGFVQGHKDARLEPLHRIIYPTHTGNIFPNLNGVLQPVGDLDVISGGGIIKKIDLNGSTNGACMSIGVFWKLQRDISNRFPEIIFGVGDGDSIVMVLPQDLHLNNDIDLLVEPYTLGYPKSPFTNVAVSFHDDDLFIVDDRIVGSTIPDIDRRLELLESTHKQRGISPEKTLFEDD